MVVLNFVLFLFVPASNSKDHQSDSSPPRYDGTEMLQTIELSNDSNESSDKRPPKEESLSSATATTPPRIYLKKDLANPDNLQPEMLMRFRDVILPDMERNGVGVEGMTGGSASDNDAPQD